MVTVLAALLGWRAREGAVHLHYYSPDEYVERANHFIEQRYLTADCSGEAPRLVPHLKSPSPEESWYNDSYLSQDVKRFNENPDDYAWTFFIDPDCVLRGVNPVVHRIILPFTPRRSWLGSIFYGGRGPDASLRSVRRTITLRQTERDVPARHEGRTEVGGGDNLTEEGVVLLHYGGGAGFPAARLYHVGSESVVLHNRSHPERGEVVRLMGHRLPVGRIVGLETGDWVFISGQRPSPREEMFVFVGGKSLDPASVVRLRNDRHERVSDDPGHGRAPDDPGLGRVPDESGDEGKPFLDVLARSIDTSLEALPEKRAEEEAHDFDLQITLDHRLQRDLGAMLRRRVRELQKERGSDRQFPAAITVMDGKTGNLLALATSPWEEDLGTTNGLDGHIKRFLLQNQNLRRHPIGSAGKPFFFAAIADAYPFLMELTIDGHSPEERHRELLQCELPSGYQLLGGHSGKVDFRRALEISCNKYAVELGTLALAAQRGGRAGEALTGLLPPDADVQWPRPGRSSGVTIGGRPLTYAPELGQFVIYQDRVLQERESGAARRCATLDRLGLVPFADSLARLTGTAVFRGRTPKNLPPNVTEHQLYRGYVTNLYDLRTWSPLLGHLMSGASEQAAWKIRTAIQGVSPERVNLALNQVTRLREEYVSMLLGGASSTWTNVQLSEALSRLVTGRQVQARLVARILKRDEPEPEPALEEPPPSIDLRPEARQAVLEGLDAVVKGRQGTAHTLSDDLRRLREEFPGDRIALFSKTGSPDVLLPVPATVGEAVTALVARGRLEIDGKRLLVGFGPQQVPYAAPGTAGEAMFRATVGRSLKEVGFGEWGRGSNGR